VQKSVPLTRGVTLAFVLSKKVILTLAILGVLFLTQTASAQSSVFSVYLHPAGSDQNSGLTQNQAVQSLQRAEAVLQNQKPTTDVEVRIAPGTYYPTKAISWKFSVPGKKITFAPTGYQLGSSGWSNRPVFDGSKVADPSASFNYWLGFSPSSSASGVFFYYLEARNWVNGLKISSFDQSTNAGKSFSNYQPNVYGMKFYKIGNKWAGTRRTAGWTCISLTRSRYHSVRNNHCINAENRQDGIDANGKPSDFRPLIHALYISHSSSYNLVSANNVKTVSGNAMKTRDRSNFNFFEGNRIDDAGIKSAYHEWFQEYCEPGEGCVDSSGKERNECSSHGNRFYSNILGTRYSGYGGSSWLQGFTLVPSDVWYQTANCYSTSMGYRLATSSNTRL
jgi:hypothetical protein